MTFQFTKITGGDSQMAAWKGVTLSRIYPNMRSDVVIISNHSAYGSEMRS